MNLSEIYDWAGPPRGQPVADLTGALRALGVQVEFWQNHTPRPLDVDAVRTHFEESAETSLRDHDILLRKFAEGDPEIAELVVRSMAESLFGATSHEKFTLLSKGHDGYLELLRGLNSVSYIWWLVSGADRLAEDGNIDSAIEVYREAIEECPRPNLHSELGRILADRAGVSSHLVGAPESAILSELDISLPLTFTWDSSGNETSTRPQQPELLEDSLLDHPLGSQSKKLLRLALESYGRAYVGHLTELADEMTSMEAESLFSRHCLVLDGLRVLFLEMDMLEEAEIVCHVFEIWNGVITEQKGEAARVEFLRRFAQTLGFLEGRRVELIVQQAVEHARRAVVVSDPDAFADNLLQGISERLGRIPTRTRAEIENDCNLDLSGTWQPLPDPVKQSLIEAEWLKQLLENNDGRDYRGVVIGYGAVLEGLLRHLDGSKDNLSQFRQRIRRYRERRIPFLRVGSVNEEFVRRVDEFVDIRDKAAHGDDKKQHDISRSLMLKARDTIFGTTDKPSILARLVKARET